MVFVERVGTRSDSGRLLKGVANCIGLGLDFEGLHGIKKEVWLKAVQSVVQRDDLVAIGESDVQ